MFGFLGVCDLPQATLDSFMEYAIKTVQPDAFVWLGDNPAHNTWQQEAKDHMTTIKNISLTLNATTRYHSLGSVYPVLGNHEGLPVNNFDVYGRSHDWVLGNTTELWRQWLTTDSYKLYRHTGCYSQLHPNSSLRMVVLSPFVYLGENAFVLGNQSDPLGMVFRGYSESR